eukprot:8809424-Heterocapsa_arctica.AAC.1
MAIARGLPDGPVPPKTHKNHVDRKPSKSNIWCNAMYCVSCWAPSAMSEAAAGRGAGRRQR